MAGQTKVSLYNQADLKNTSDDALANYLNSIKFKQNHNLTNTRLILGYGSFLIAAACFAWDYNFGFEATKVYSAGAVAAYVALQGALWYWQTKVEEGTVYSGTAPSGEELYIASSTKKNEPTTYFLTVAIISGERKEHKAFELKKSFTEYFDETGYFVAAPFQEFLASNVSVVGRADPKRVRSASEKLLETNPELLDALSAASVTEGATGVDAKSGGKRRKV